MILTKDIESYTVSGKLKLRIKEVLSGNGLEVVDG